MNLDLCTSTASDGGEDTAAAPHERVAIAIGMILVGAMLQQGGGLLPIPYEIRKMCVIV